MWPDEDHYVEKLEQLINSKDGKQYILAVGECGLDKKIEDKKEQIRLFTEPKVSKHFLFINCWNMDKDFCESNQRIPAPRNMKVFDQFVQIDNPEFSPMGIVSN